jgi:hypothetical protein
MWASVEAVRIIGADFHETVNCDDRPPGCDGVVNDGWTVIDGAVLLRNWYRSYFGERSRFSELMDYEIAVNGRGIPDMDLVETGEALVARLLRRGVAFAWEALHEQYRQLPDVRMTAYISAAPTLVDPDHYTGNVTFCEVRPAWPPYVDPKRLTDEIIIALFTEDCEKPLPGSG